MKQTTLKIITHFLFQWAQRENLKDLEGWREHRGRQPGPAALPGLARGGRGPRGHRRGPEHGMPGTPPAQLQLRPAGNPEVCVHKGGLNPQLQCPGSATPRGGSPECAGQGRTRRR